ncbi:MAG: SDR family NAD(P)-dependent oxidoreductase [Anaerolineales bacterium]|nr:SDR family NAD(P)-dependent oxidoreductase [Anaerolineales bacterium]
MPVPTLLITGASRGLGAAAARQAAALGAHVILNARSADALTAVANAITAAGGRATAVPGDVSLEADCRRLVETAVAATGRLDALVNNAGTIDPIQAIANTDPDAWLHSWQVNVLGPMRLTQLALPHLRASRGRVLHVSSGAAVNAVPGWAAYCTAKAALNHFSRVLAAEEPDVTSISFRPGVVDTTMQAEIRRKGAAGMPTNDHAYFVSLHHEGKLLPPDEPGRALAFLALHAPRSWSGEFVQWDDHRVQQLVMVNG